MWTMPKKESFIRFYQISSNNATLYLLKLVGVQMHQVQWDRLSFHTNQSSPALCMPTRSFLLRHLFCTDRWPDCESHVVSWQISTILVLSAPEVTTSISLSIIWHLAWFLHLSSLQIVQLSGESSQRFPAMFCEWCSVHPPLNFQLVPSSLLVSWTFQ